MLCALNGKGGGHAWGAFFAPQVQWMSGQAGDLWGPAYLILTVIAGLIIWGLRYLSRKPTRYDNDVTRQRAQRSVQRFRLRRR